MPQLQILSGKRQGETVELQPGAEVDIGNRKSARLSIRDPWVSYNHARIVVESGRFVIEDQDSSNGTWLDAPSGPKRIKRHELVPNDVFALGKTRIKFLADAPAPVTAAFTGPGMTRRLPQDQPWWDRGVEAPGSGPGSGEGRVGGGQLEQELREERRMRQALERFLELPEGSPVGDLTRAGELEREVAELKQKLARGAGGAAPADIERAVSERTERLRQEQVTKTVELEGRASAAEAKVVDLERRLLDKAEQSKKEVARAREKAQAELDELKAALEEARAANRDLAAGGDTALESATQRTEKLEAELEEARARARAAEERAEKAERERKEAAADTRLQQQLEEALSQVEHWKREHQTVIQEIDDISMEQIEIEDALKARVKELEARLTGLGQSVPPPAAPQPRQAAREEAEEPPELVDEPPELVDEPPEPVEEPTDERATEPETFSLDDPEPAPALEDDGFADEPPAERVVATYDSASLGVLPTSELAGPPAMDDADMDGSADLTASSESSLDES